jgi:hypothetical protein
VRFYLPNIPSLFLLCLKVFPLSSIEQGMCNAKNDAFSKLRLCHAPARRRAGEGTRLKREKYHGVDI